MKAVFTLKSAESRRLLAKATIATPEFQAALKNAYVVLAGGTTNAYIAQELLNDKTIEPQTTTIGISSHGVLCVSHPDSRKLFPVVYKKGVPMPEMSIQDAFNDFNVDTIVVKGANAVDPEHNVGIVTSGFDGGTIPKVIGTMTSTGLRMINPVGLEKMVASVKDAAMAVGAKRIDISLGADFGMYCLSTTQVITEIEALNVLFGVKATHVASGGVGGNEGAVILAVEGTEEQVTKCVEYIEANIKGEPPVPANKGICDKCNYKRCRYYGKHMDELPAWLQD